LGSKGAKVDEDFEINVQGDSSEISLGVECSLFGMAPDEPSHLQVFADAPTQILVDPEDDTLLYVRRV
jgi:hypothetical protein